MTNLMNSGRMQQDALTLSLYPLMRSDKEHYDGILFGRNPICLECSNMECLNTKKLKDFELLRCYAGLLSCKITIFDEAYIAYGLNNDFTELTKKEKKNYPNRIYFRDIEAMKKWKNNINKIYFKERDYQEKNEKNDSVFIHDIKKTFSTVYRKIEHYIKSHCEESNDMEQCIKNADPDILGIYKAVGLINYQFDVVDYISNPESVKYGGLKRIKIYKAIDKLVRIFQTTSRTNLKIEGSSHNEVYLYDSFMTLIFVLLDNAIKYGQEQSGVTVKVNDYGGDVEISISSYSPYISKESQEKIFKKYYRENDDLVEGQGIGLYLAQIISDSLQAPIKISTLSDITNLNGIDYALMEFSFYVTNLE